MENNDQTIMYIILYYTMRACNNIEIGERGIIITMYNNTDCTLLLPDVHSGAATGWQRQDNKICASNR